MRDFLKDRKEGEPFCYWFGPTNCHRKWIQGSGKELWGLNPDDLKGKMPPFLPDNEIVRQEAHVFFQARAADFDEREFIQALNEIPDTSPEKRDRMPR